VNATNLFCGAKELVVRTQSYFPSLLSSVWKGFSQVKLNLSKRSSVDNTNESGFKRWCAADEIFQARLRC
jgi:hypothetical protein